MSRPAPLPHWAVAALWTSALVLAVAPVLAAKIAPLADYPAHIARIAALIDIERDGPLARYYRLDTFLLPNAAFDLVALEFARLTSVETAGRLFVALTQLLTVGGCVALGRAATGRVGLAPFVACIYMVNGILAYGFLNYLFGIAVLLWACAACLTLADRPGPIRLAVASLFALALFFAHLEALGLFGVWIGGYELRRARSGTCGPLWPRLARLAATGLPFVAPAVLLAISPTAAALARPTLYHPDWTFKLFAVIRNFVIWIPLADDPTGMVVLIGAALLIGAGALSLAAPVRWPVAALALAYAALPVRLASANGVDARVPIAIWFVGVAMADIRLYGRAARIAALLTVGLLAGRGLVITRDWAADDRVYDEIRAELRLLPDGATLFTIDALPPGDAPLAWRPPLLHVDALAELDRHVFVPSVFATRGQQPVVVRTAYDAAFSAQGQQPLPGYTAEQRDAAVATFRTAAEGSSPGYILVLTPSPQSLKAPRQTAVVAAGPRTTLLRIAP